MFYLRPQYIICLIITVSLFAEAFPFTAIDTLKRKNNREDYVIAWVVDAAGLPKQNGYHEPGRLDVLEIRDTYERKQIFFYEVNGDEILERNQTKEQNPASSFNKYVVWDNLDTIRYIRFVLPPAFIDAFHRGVPLQENLDMFAYQYKYESSGRDTAKKLPGAGWTYKIYDSAGKLVLYQEALQKQKSKYEWSFHKYDSLGRPILVGSITTKKSFSELRDIVKAQKHLYEKREKNSAVGYTTTLSFPKISNKNINIISYYDDHSFLNSACWGKNYEAFLPKNEPEFKDDFKVDTSRKPDHVTGVKCKVSNSSQWLRTVTYFNDKNETVQIIRQNHLGGIDQISHSFSSEGLLHGTVFRHHGREELMIKKKYKYSRGTVEVKNYINDQPAVSIEYRYNSWGDLLQKRWDGVLSIVYRYKILNDAPVLTQLEFMNLKAPVERLALKIAYYDDRLHFGSPPVSNIQLDFTDANKISLGYVNSYKYDGHNRLLSAEYTIRNAKTTDRVNVDDIAYDYGGNILSLTRKFNDDVVDKLSYFYHGNTLLEVSDEGDPDRGFIDLNTEKPEYEYDANGNVIIDRNRSTLSSITYNSFNQPLVINLKNGRRYSYAYDREGNKLSCDTKGAQLNYINLEAGLKPGSPFLSEISYLNNQINFINSDDGHWVRNGDRYDFYFHITDHIDRIIGIVNNEGKIEELKNYYPFGMPIFLRGPKLKAQLFTQNASSNSLNLLEFAFRQFDPALGRFWNINVLSELELNFSPYHYAFDNPISHEVKLGLSVQD